MSKTPLMDAMWEALNKASPDWRYSELRFQVAIPTLRKLHKEAAAAGRNYSVGDFPPSFHGVRIVTTTQRTHLYPVHTHADFILMGEGVPG